ncbi:DUF1573 domain-containing protein [Candidatus Microgenomates bacterium]|nr:DUF1573 domain-containing protein [Candidatus Microgenomates bacterium]
MSNFPKNPWFLMSFALLVILGLTIFVFNGSQSVSQSSNSTSMTSTPAVNNAQLQPISGVEVSPQSFEFGDVSMKNGVVTKTFILKNKTDRDLKVAKVETSCMCTEASIKVGDKESPYFGMPGHTSNPSWQTDILKNGEAFVTAKFDPNAHGPSGVGFAKRVVRIFFSDPQNSYLDINFSANVIK